MAQDETSPPYPEGHVRRAMRGVVTALERNRSEEAVREFMQITSAGITPKSERTTTWLVSMIGKALATRLVEAFVHFPCFYCRKGRVDCEICSGRGHNSGGMPCERCIGMCVERCDFCDGSGWVTMNYVPEGLRPPVIKGRAALAIQRMKALLELPCPEVRCRDPQVSIKRARLMLLNMDRQMGVFENMVLAFGGLPADWRKARAAIKPVIRKCVLLAARAERRTCELVQVIAEGHRCLAGLMNPDSKDRKRLRQQARYYESLIDPERSLAGTGLTHPFLHDAISDVVRKRRNT